MIAAVAIASLALGAAAVDAQPNAGKGSPNPLQSLSQSNGKPVKIRSASLEVRDKDRIATFTGDVHVTQGDTELRCKVLVVYYESDALKTGGQPAQSAPPGQQQIRRMLAKGNVVVNQKDQTATGDNADYDMRSNVVTLTGNVVVTQGKNVLRGQRLVVNLTTGVSRVEGGVEGLLPQGGGGDSKQGIGQPQPLIPLQPRPAR